MTDKIHNSSFDENLTYNSNNNNDSIYKIEESKEINLYTKNKKSIDDINYSDLIKNNNSFFSKMKLCENRLINDLDEFKRSKINGKICLIKMNDHKKVENDSFELIVEFISFFSVKFIFKSDYPCSPPLIIYDKGSKHPNIFDENGNVLMESIKKENWNPSIWLSTLIYSIELLISSWMKCENNCFSNYNNNNNNQNLANYLIKTKKQKYSKRNWEAYLNDYSVNYNLECDILFTNLKKI